MLLPRRLGDAAAGEVGGVGGELGRGQEEALALAADDFDRCEDLPPPGRSSGRLA